MKTKKCPVCGSLICNTSKKCRVCANKGRTKYGISEIKHCIDCGKELAKSSKYSNSKRCYSCSNKYNWKDYDKRPNIQFKIINTEIQSYILGLLASDGNIYKKCISLASKDFDIIKIFTEYFKSPIRKYDIYRSGFKSKRISDELKELGLKERKSTTKGLKVLFNNIPDYLKNHFVRGFLDGDGSINNNKSRYTVAFYNTDKELLKEIVKYINIKKYSLMPTFKKYNTVWALAIWNKKHFFKIYHLLYDDSNYCLTRKRNKFTDVLEFEKKHGLEGRKVSKETREKMSKAKIKSKRRI